MVEDSADRFGARNPQQYKFLRLRLMKNSADELGYGLLDLFFTAPGDHRNIERQELAGRLLLELSPQFEFDLKTTLRMVLPNYELSVEQLPQYLVGIFGKDEVTHVLQNMQGETRDEQYLRNIQTMHFWIRGMSSSQG